MGMCKPRLGKSPNHNILSYLQVPGPLSRLLFYFYTEFEYVRFYTFVNTFPYTIGVRLRETLFFHTEHDNARRRH